MKGEIGTEEAANAKLEKLKDKAKESTRKARKFRAQIHLSHKKKTHTAR